MIEAVIARHDQFDDHVLAEALLEKLHREGTALSEALDNLKVLMVHRHQAEQAMEPAQQTDAAIPCCEGEETEAHVEAPAATAPSKEPPKHPPPAIV